MDAAEQALTTARAKLEAETQNAKETKAQIDELLSWAECFDKANTETKHMIMARLIEWLTWATVTRCISSSRFLKPSLKGLTSKKRESHSGGKTRRVFFLLFTRRSVPVWQSVHT